MNKVILHGRIARDPDVRTTQSGRTVARLTIAVDRGKDKDGNNKGADFISCVAWEKTAELLGKYFPKGKEILTEGRIQTGSYEKDGQKRYTTDVIIDRIEFCGSKNDGQAAPSGDDEIPFF